MSISNRPGVDRNPLARRVSPSRRSDSVAACKIENGEGISLRADADPVAPIGLGRHREERSDEA
jgi:hypothetical protein